MRTAPAVMRLRTRITAGEKKRLRYSHLKQKECEVEGAKTHLYNLVKQSCTLFVGVML